jgi:hypothetical protein
MGVWFWQGSSTINASSFTALSDILLSAIFDIGVNASVGAWNVSVEDAVDGTLTLAEGFTILAREPLTVYVDNDAPEDPEPNNPDVSDPNEDGSPEHPFDAIQEAIDFSIDGDTIIVLNGTYAGSGNRDIDFWGRSITVRSENGPEGCVIDCNGVYDGFYFFSGEDSNSALQGFTVKNGLHGVYCYLSSPKITDCRIVNNSYGGISCYYASPEIVNCSVVGNICDAGGGIVCYESSPTMANCLIAGNYALHGGGIVCVYNSMPTVAQCTISGNFAQVSGGGVACSSSICFMTNCILWENTAGLLGDAVYLEYYGESSSLIIDYSDIQDGRAGVHAMADCTVNWGSGNVDVDPRFVSPGYWEWGEWVEGDHRLLPDSLCIDAGDPNYSMDGYDFDIDGNRRVCGPRVDMGAYEYCPERILDLNNDGILNFEDFAIWAYRWADGTCLWPDWCEGCDFDESGAVDNNDLALLSNRWLDEFPVGIYSQPLDSDPCWATTGEWGFGRPTGEGGTEYGNPDPTGGYTGINVYGVNLRGDYDTAVGGPYYLTCGPFDCSDFNEVSLKFARWLNTDESAFVESTIEISDDGTSWSAVWEHTRPDLADSSWRIVEYDISSIADNQETVYIRWGYQIQEYAYPYSGWNIDDVELWGNPVRY